jgi:hypothetical protein
VKKVVLKYTEPRKAFGAEIIGYSERGRRNLDDVLKVGVNYLVGPFVEFLHNIIGRNPDFYSFV